MNVAAILPSQKLLTRIKTMKTLKPELQNKVSKIDFEIQNLQQSYDIKNENLKQQMGITDSYFDCNFDKWTDNDWNYSLIMEQELADTDYKINRLNAKKAAILLIGLHIARRGKPLHQNTAFKKLEKLGETGNWLKSQIENSYSLHGVINAHAYLHSELKRTYNVILLDENLFISIHGKIEKSPIAKFDHQSSKNNKGIDNNILKLKKILKLFNGSVTKNLAIRRQQFKEMAF